MECLRIASCNVRGLRDLTKRQHIFKYFREKQLDIIFLQETHSTQAEASYWRTNWGGKAYFSHGTSNARGVTTLVSRKAKIKIDEVENDVNSRWSKMLVKIEETNIMLLNIYAPNDDNPKYFQDINALIESSQEEYDHIIVGGDFNLVIDTVKDKIGGREHTHTKARLVLNKIIEQHQLLDIWRHQHNDSKEYTWKKYNPDIIFERLDYFLVSATLLDRIT